MPTAQDKNAEVAPHSKRRITRSDTLNCRYTLQHMDNTMYIVYTYYILQEMGASRPFLPSFATQLSQYFGASYLALCTCAFISTENNYLMSLHTIKLHTLCRLLFQFLCCNFIAVILRRCDFVLAKILYSRYTDAMFIHNNCTRAFCLAAASASTAAADEFVRCTR